MDPFFHLVERRIEEAQRAGAFDDLPGRGKPLLVEDLSQVPAELRACYILLKTHGFLPPEVEARKEWLRLRDLVAACLDPAERAALGGAAQRAWLRYRLLLERGGGGPAWIDYRDQVLARLDRAR